MWSFILLASPGITLLWQDKMSSSLIWSQAVAWCFLLRSCPIHPSNLSFTSLVTNLTYPIHTHATCSSSNLIYLLTCTQYDSSMWARLKILCSLEWMATGPPPTVLTTYPFQSQSTLDVTNSLLIPVEMYAYSINCPLILIPSPTAILNLSINSFCPLDTALVLTSDNFLQSLPFLQPPGGTFQKLSSDAILVVCSHTFTFWLRKKSVTVKIFQICFCVFACVFPLEISSIFGKSFPFPFPYFVLYIKEEALNIRNCFHTTSSSDVNKLPLALQTSAGSH